MQWEIKPIIYFNFDATVGFVVNQTLNTRLLSVSCTFDRIAITDQPMDQKVSVIIERDDTHFFAYCPELEDCRAEGESVENVLANMKQAIAMYLQRLDKEEIVELTSREIYATTLSISFD